MTLPRRTLGLTGLDVTILGLGCGTIGYGPHTVDEGAQIVEACIDGGINYIDCASQYLNAEEKVGQVMKRRRSEVVLATKCLERGKDDAWREINRSLERLQTGAVDLLQVHAINSMSELDQVSSDEGSLRAVVRAKEEKMCRFVGITGHASPEVIAAAMERYDFATILCPLSSTDAVMNDFAPIVFPLARKHGCGVIAMKVLAAGKMVRHPARSLRYALSLPVSSAIVGMGTADEVRENIAVAEALTPMSTAEMRALEEETRAVATTKVMWWKKG